MKKMGPTARRAVTCALSIGLAGSLALAPMTALADVPYDWVSDGTVVDSNSAEAGQSHVSDTASYPAQYSLNAFTMKDPARGTTISTTGFVRPDGAIKDVVSHVKNQSPWGSCWAFATISAAETSIESEAFAKGVTLPSVLTDKNGDVDLSEAHLAWFAYSPLSADAAEAAGYASQVGEGFHNIGDSTNFDKGGLMAFGTTLFSSGLGVMPEVNFPYQAQDGSYDKLADWSIPEFDEEGNSNRFGYAVQLEETAKLAPTGPLSAEGKTKELQAAIQSYKDQLLEGKGVSIAFMADTSSPEDDRTATMYINTNTWAHYTPEAVGINHAVTIVGWDDAYSKDNFPITYPAGVDADGNVIYEKTSAPAGDGAWLVRNSWGAKGETGNDKGDWGIDGTGYFWLSYYDKTITIPETFDFDVESIENEQREGYVNNQYDLMPAMDTSTRAFSTDNPVSMVNVFTAEDDQQIRALTVETSMPDTSVELSLYRIESGETVENALARDAAATVGTTFDYAGFHTAELDPSTYVSLSKGDRFAVKATVKSDDGYLISVDRGTNQTYANAYAEELTKELKEGSEGWNKLLEETRNKMYYLMMAAYEDTTPEQRAEEADKRGLEGEERKAFLDDYVNIMVKELMDNPEIDNAIVEAVRESVKSQIETARTNYSKGVVNKGESFVASSEGLADLTELRNVLADQEHPEWYDIDNFPIKAYGYQDLATTEQRLTLERDFANASLRLREALSSADGTDVLASDNWVPTALYDELDAVKRQIQDALSDKELTGYRADELMARFADVAERFGAAMKPGTYVAPRETLAMLRLYNPNSGEHFYTRDVSEKDYLVKVGWNYEGVGWLAPEAGAPVYRMYNPNAGDHHYTESPAERDHLVSVGWNYEGIGWYSDEAKGVPILRQYNPNAATGAHNYTPNKAENDWLVSLGWKAEGIGWHGVAV